MKIVINAEIVREANMHDGSEPYTLYETNLMGADGSPVLLTDRTLGKLWNVVEDEEKQEPEEPENVDGEVVSKVPDGDREELG